MLPRKLLAELRRKRNKTFLISAHIHLEGDALGSELALASLLRSLGKKVMVLNEDRVPQEYRFLPGSGSVRPARGPLDYDVAVLVDCSDVSRIGNVRKVLRSDRKLLNIDHHISNEKFADINWVEPRASSASEMVYELFGALGVRMKKADALCLYVGIMTDTGSFKYKSTSARTHRIAGELCQHGLDVYGIYRRIYESMSPLTVKSLAKIIGTLDFSKDKKVAWLKVSHALLCKDPKLAEQTDDIIHFARAISGVEVAILFKEIRPGRETRVNLRSTGKVNANAIAQIFGGGGHRMASGVTIKGVFADVVRRVVKEAVGRVS
jgi:phosphoesterase RecJ-like protein